MSDWLRIALTIIGLLVILLCLTVRDITLGLYPEITDDGCEMVRDPESQRRQ